MEPVRILVDTLRQRKPGIVFLRHVHNHFAGAHDARQRGSQIMGNGPQKIAPIAFLIGFLPGADALLHRPQPIHRQRSAFHHGVEQLLLLLRQCLRPVFGKAQNAKNGFTSVDGPIAEFHPVIKVGPQILNAVPDSVGVGNAAPHLLRFRFLLNKGALRLPLLVKAQAGGLAVHSAADGLHCDPGNILHALRVCQVAGQVVQRTGFLLVADSLRRHLLRLGGQGAGDHRGHSHDGKGDEIGGIIHGQREIGRCKESVKSASGKNGGQNTPEIPVGTPCRQNHRQNVDNHNIGFRELPQPEQSANPGGCSSKHKCAEQTTQGSSFQESGIRHSGFPPFFVHGQL